jgi:plasmid stabilization system protein ParE
MLPVVTTPAADRDIRRAHAWWGVNREVAPHLFAEELAAAFALLAASPLIGRSYRTGAVRGVRRILMRATRYHVYYVPTASRVVVLAVWAAVRAQRPPLRRA